MGLTGTARGLLYDNIIIIKVLAPRGGLEPPTYGFPPIDNSPPLCLTELPGLT